MKIDLAELLTNPSRDEDEQSKKRFNNLPDFQQEAWVALLLEKFDLLDEWHDFQIGDLVELKPGLAGSQKDEGVWIVTEVLDTPMTDTETSDTKDSGNCRWNEPLDLRLMCCKSGEFIEFWYDRRRFQPYTGPRP